MEEGWRHWRETRAFRAEGTAVLERLLAAAAAGDTAAVRTMATDSLAARIALFRREGAMGEIEAAARGLAVRDARVAADGAHGELVFRYQHRGEEWLGAARVQRVDGAWRVRELWMLVDG